MKSTPAAAQGHHGVINFLVCSAWCQKELTILIPNWNGGLRVRRGDNVTHTDAPFNRAQNSGTGTRTQVARVRAKYPNQLDYAGAGASADSMHLLSISDPQKRRSLQITGADSTSSADSIQTRMYPKAAAHRAACAVRTDRHDSDATSLARAILEAARKPPSYVDAVIRNAVAAADPRNTHHMS